MSINKALLKLAPLRKLNKDVQVDAEHIIDGVMNAVTAQHVVNGHVVIITDSTLFKGCYGVALQFSLDMTAKVLIPVGDSDYVALVTGVINLKQITEGGHIDTTTSSNLLEVKTAPNKLHRKTVYGKCERLFLVPYNRLKGT